MNQNHLRYAITERTLSAVTEAGQRQALLDQAARLAASNIDLLQLREKDLPTGELTRLARTLLDILRPSRTRLLINSRADVAIATEAHGVHLTSTPDELTPRQIHALYRHAGLPTPFVSVSCHTLDDIRRHTRPSAIPPDAILFGPVFHKSIAGQHITAGTGLTLLTEACTAASPIPVLALGGITPSNTPACLTAGAAGVAGIRLFQHP